MPQNQQGYEPVSQNADTEFKDFVSKPRKKRARRASIFIFTGVAIVVLTFCILNRNEEKYYLLDHPDYKTDECYGKRNTLAFTDLFTVVMGLFGILIGILVDRLTLVAEERHHLKERYGGSKTRMIKACFSGIQMRPVIALICSTLVTVIVMIYLTNRSWDDLRHVFIIISGIGVGPIVIQLLDLNTQSEVYVSTVAEENGLYLANGLAWYYYFNYLEKALPQFEAAAERSIGTSDEKLSLNKLLLLIPTSDSWVVKEKLEKLDETNIQFIEHIKSVDTEAEDSYKFPVYRLTDDINEPKIYAIQYAQEPLLTLRVMSERNIKPINGRDANPAEKKNLKDEIKSLYLKLSEIFDEFPNCKRACMLVPIQLPGTKRVRAIIDAVEPLCNQASDSPNKVNKELAELNTHYDSLSNVDIDSLD